MRFLYVDDSMTAVGSDRIDQFHKHLNEQSAHIQFTKEIKKTAYVPLFTENHRTLTDY